MISYFVGSITLLLLDIGYIVVNKTKFIKQIYKIQKSEVSINYWTVLLCYIFIFLTLYYFIWREGRTAFHATLLGFAIYGIYNTTIVSIFKEWDLLTAGIDILWGGFLFGASTFAFNSVKKFKIK
jgi:uncharacterized membrane protein